MFPLVAKGIYVSSSEKSLFRLFVHFKIGSLGIFVVVDKFLYRVLFVFWVLVFYQEESREMRSSALQAVSSLTSSLAVQKLLTLF